MTNAAHDGPVVLPSIPNRDPDGHKGTFGTVGVMGGCALSGTRMIGAPALAALAALRVGAGLAKLYMPGPVLDAAMGIAPSTTGRALEVDESGSLVPHAAAEALDELIRGSDCLVIGPGLGKGEGPRAVSLRAVQQEDTPVVVDADALNSLAETPQLTRDLHAAAVLTPHPGEFTRLCEGMGLKNALGMAHSREDAAAQMAQRLGCIVVLKGARTVVSNGIATWTNDLSDSCLSTAGTGDVLSGTIAGLVSQFVAPPPAVALPEAIAAKMPKPKGKPLTLFEAACLGVRSHGIAAKLWREAHGWAESGLLAEELTAFLPGAIQSLRANGV